MEDLFTIHEAAKKAGMTEETLRHYDRIGLVKPARRDDWTRYRYYSQQDIVRLNTIAALRCMDLSLKEIGQVLDYDDLGQITAFLKEAERMADEKIANLRRAKEKIKAARRAYEQKQSAGEAVQEPFIRELPGRMILLSPELETPALDNLWNYLHHFYQQLAPERRAAYDFEDLAGVYTCEGRSRMFAVCTRYPDAAGLTVLPGGPYLCANCAQEQLESVRQQLVQESKRRTGSAPAFSIALVVVSGILQWHYQLQVPLMQAGDGQA